MRDAIVDAVNAIRDAIDAIDAAEPTPRDYAHDPDAYRRAAERHRDRWEELALIARSIALIAADDRHLRH